MIKILSGVVVASLGAALLASSGAHATVAFANGGFEAGTSTGWDLMNATNTPGWTLILSDNFPRLNLNIPSGGPYGANNEARQFATIGGTEDGGTSALEQTVGGFTVGGTYTLSWIQASEFTDMDGLSVSFTSGSSTPGQVFYSNPYPGGSAYWQSWQPFSMKFVADASSVTFHFNSFGTNYEVGVDDFKLAGDVPEPASWALMIAGFGMVGATMRRRRIAVA